MRCNFKVETLYLDVLGIRHNILSTRVWQTNVAYVASSKGRFDKATGESLSGGARLVDDLFMPVEEAVVFWEARLAEAKCANSVSPSPLTRSRIQTYEHRIEYLKVRARSLDLSNWENFFAHTPKGMRLMAEEDGLT